MADVPKEMNVPKSESEAYEPSPAERQLISEVEDKFSRWRAERQPYEIQWFMNAAMLRGNQSVVWNESKGILERKGSKNNGKVRLTINRILPKIRARVAKFLKNRMTWQVTPASTDREDWLNARATQKVLDYVYRKASLESKYKEALGWTMVAGKGFWWFYWDPAAMARVKQTDPLTGKDTIEMVRAGDVGVEVGSPFEVLVSNPGCTKLAEQPEIMRVKMRDIEDVRTRYAKGPGKFVKADSNDSEAFQYEKQIARIHARGTGAAEASREEKPNKVMVKELFTRPCAKYPQGRMVVVANGVLLKQQEELPYTFYDYPNPYPVVEFTDIEVTGQFWPTTHIEQMIGLQKEYNFMRSGMQHHARLLMHGKLLVPDQFRIPRDAWTSEPGEIIRYVAMPGIPAPVPWSPPNISADAYRLVEMVKGEFDDVTNIYPASHGSGAGASSGFETNLLQEAADSVHAPDIRQHELSHEDAAFKLRRLISIGWDVKRVVTVTGRKMEPEVFEFSAEQIDDNADIIVQTSSALSSSPATRSQQVLELFNSGLLGDPADPEVRRQALSMLSINTQEIVTEVTHRDEELARLENLEFERGMEVEFPKLWENHNIHWTYHTDQLKSPDTREWPDEKRLALIAHVAMHAKYIDPNKAVQIAQEFGLTQLIPLIMPEPQAPPPGAPAVGPQAPPPEGGVPPGPPMEQPPPGPPMMDPAVMPPEAPPMV